MNKFACEGPGCRRNTHRNRLVLAFGTTILAGSQFIFLGGLRPFALGLWFQSEPVVLAHFVSGGLAAFALAAVVLADKGAAAILRNPVVLALAAMTLWSGLAAGAAPLPMRSWFGAPETGEGVLALLALTAETALAASLWRRRGPRLVVAASAALAVAAIVLLNLGYLLDHSATAAAWPEYAAFAGLFLLVTLSCLPDRRPRVRHLRWVAAAVAVAAVALSRNRSAMALLAAAPVLWLGIRTGQRHLAPRRLRLAVVGLALIAPLAAASAMAGMAALGGNHSAVARATMGKVGIERLRAEPMLLLSGTGWGSFNDTLLAYANAAGASYYQGTVAKPSWEGLGGGAFHCHDEVLETVLSVGLPGAALAAVAVIFLIRAAPRRRFAAVAAFWLVILALTGVWFLLPPVLPFAALAIGATAARWRPRTLPSPPALAWGPPLAGGLLLAAAAVPQYETAKGAERLLAAVNGPPPAGAAAQAYGDDRRGGHHLWWIALNFTVRLNEQIQAGRPVSGAEAEWLRILLGAIDRQAALGTASLRLRSLGVAIRNDLARAMGDHALDPVRAEALPAWRERIEQLLMAAPRRTDLAIPYLDHRLRNGDRPEVLSFANRLLAADPTDPVGLWFSGLALLPAERSIPLGLSRLVQAVDRGVNRFLPVEQPLEFTFANGAKVAVDTDGALVAHLYTAAFRRLPEAGGLRKWTREFKLSVAPGQRATPSRRDYSALATAPLLSASGHSLAWQLLHSPEFSTLYPALRGATPGNPADDRAFVAQIWSNVLGHRPGADVLARSVAAIEGPQHYSYEQTLAAIAVSPENLAADRDRIYLLPAAAGDNRRP